MSKSVMSSIQPYYVFLIIAKKMGWDIPQEKRIEVRKDYPKDTAWNKTVHIYCSKNRKSFKRIPKEYQPLMKKFLGKVIGEFVCDKVDEYNFNSNLTKFNNWGLPIGTYSSYLIFEDDYNAMCLTYEEVKAYGKGKTLYGLHISDLVIYDTLKDLREFKGAKICPDWENDDSFDNTENCYNCEHYVGCNGYLPLTTPPMSWYYVEA